MHVSEGPFDPRQESKLCNGLVSQPFNLCIRYSSIGIETHTQMKRVNKCNRKTDNNEQTDPKNLSKRIMYSQIISKNKNEIHGEVRNPGLLRNIDIFPEIVAKTEIEIRAEHNDCTKNRNGKLQSLECRCRSQIGRAHV